jgi:hypothetical protein
MKGDSMFISCQCPEGECYKGQRPHRHNQVVCARPRHETGNIETKVLEPKPASEAHLQGTQIPHPKHHEMPDG